MFDYLAFEAAKAGNEQAKKIYKSGTELLNVFLDGLNNITKAMAENPLIDTLQAVAFITTQLLAYTGLVDEPYKIKFQSGVEDMYFSEVKTLNTLFESKPKGKKCKLKSSGQIKLKTKKYKLRFGVKLKLKSD